MLEGSHRDLRAAGFGVSFLINSGEIEEATKNGGSLGRWGLLRAAGSLGDGSHNGEDDPGFKACAWYPLHLPSSICR